MRKKWYVLILILGWGVGISFAFSVYYFKRCITPRTAILPRRDIVFQEYIQFAQAEPTGRIGFVNADGSGKITSIVAHPECCQEKNFYGGAQLRMPFIEHGEIGFLIHPQPYTIYGGRLQIYDFVKRLPCSFSLSTRPSPVGQDGAYVGIYQWAEDGGAVLFWPREKECRPQDLWSVDELQEMGVFQVIGFHRKEAVLLLGKEVPQKYDLTTGELVPFPWLPASCWGMISRDDRWLACEGYKTQEYRIYSIRVVSLDSGGLWRERQIPRELTPSFGMGPVSWSPDGKALVYHRCREPNLEDPEACEELGADNVGIYIWDLETDEERLVTTGGIMPYWIDWGSVPTKTPSP